jgi:hypothetical protein
VIYLRDRLQALTHLGDLSAKPHYTTHYVHLATIPRQARRASRHSAYSTHGRHGRSGRKGSSGNASPEIAIDLCLSPRRETASEPQSDHLAGVSSRSALIVSTRLPVNSLRLVESHCTLSCSWLDGTMLRKARYCLRCRHTIMQVRSRDNY